MLHFAVKNIIDDILFDYPNTELFEDQTGHIVLLIPNIETGLLLELNRDIINHLERFIGKVVVCNEIVLESFLDFPFAYKKLIKDMKLSQNLTPIVVLAKNYIDQHYSEQSVSLKQVADQVQVNPTYLSKQIKSELGVSFVHYLTNVRINKALKLIKDPYLKIYEIAEMVGYSSQHYFCNAFKKVVGISPTEFRNGVKKQ
ncbi:AraC family transcriptional regulator [Lederbergia sp. NSJ-179]|uniref:helix-turn-helix transcriptional regulator n=1 Tax=Lederbergia sp. NSJ-179 TaxID=2931402 RepID=UPI001FD1366D|nr:AraC family transcriptional regulator [Lederbergia sp. NSJ-179]MCJ7843235.1 AraC family transcriptional regulator [Lederbergia sp. NSJ-179]